MSIKREYDFPEVGEKDMYLLHHEEIESLAKNIPGVKRIRFFMTFGQSYLTHNEMYGKRWNAFHNNRSTLKEKRSFRSSS